MINENMLEVFFYGMFQFKSEIEEKTIIRMAENKEVGNEFSYCTYEKNDEDYKEGYVAVLFFKPFVEEDIVLYYENKVFYEELMKFLQQFVDAKTKIMKIEKYLTIIRNDLMIE